MGGMTGCLALADGAGPDTEWVGSAAMRIAHRGPDDEAFFADHHVALGFRRLAIIDTSTAGRQPMQSADGRFVTVFDMAAAASRIRLKVPTRLTAMTF